jgi:hypothetical protein
MFELRTIVVAPFTVNVLRERHCRARPTDTNPKVDARLTIA